MFLIDTNIFLELFLNQKRAEEVSRFLKEKLNKGFYISKFTFYSLEIILLSRPKEEVLLGLI